MNTRESLLRACEENPGETFLVFADWLEEHGEELLAKAYRWCGENNKYPKEDGWYPPSQTSDDYPNSCMLPQEFMILHRSDAEVEIRLWQMVPPYLAMEKLAKWFELHHESN